MIVPNISSYFIPDSHQKLQESGMCVFSKQVQMGILVWTSAHGSDYVKASSCGAGGLLKIGIVKFRIVQC